ncbi:MAG: HDIG domain-containing protein [Anaerolineae bacterium]|nr:HDIG domain-containing protein [Anaerolineae bacterium]
MNTPPTRLTQLVAFLRQERWRTVLYRMALGLLLVLFVLTGTVLVSYDALAAANQSLVLEAGQVAPEDVRAPFSRVYESALLTEQARQLAMDSVRDIYDPSDPLIARQQSQLAQQVLDYIADVRADDYATHEMLVSDIRAINSISLSADEIEALLAITPERWRDIEEQIVLVLERAMRAEIRQDTLRSVKLNLPNLVSVSFRVDEVALITAVVEDLIVTNTFLNEELTRQAREAAAAAVEPSQVEIRQGQLIALSGEIVTDLDLEAMTQLGLLQPEDRRLQEVLSGFLIMLISTVVLGLYLARFQTGLERQPSFVGLLGMIFLIALMGARIASPERVVQPYLYPTAAFGLILAALAGPQPAVVGTAVLAMLFGVMSGGSLPLAVMAGLGGLVGILSLRKPERINSYFVAGVLVSLANSGVVLVFYLTGTPSDSLGALTLVGAGIINGLLAAAIAIAGLYLLGTVFNIPTNIKLIELTQPSHPLMQRLLREAPGTYQHSLQVANLAELAAELVGANATLSRVGALYHDVGKMIAPHFFVENQVDGINPHAALDDPYKSARIIVGHVFEGDKLARKYRLPSRIRDFILEHHGTTAPMYFYMQAVAQAGGDEDAVGLTQFSYPGPRPRSRETAILMLADGCESTVRARRPSNKQEIADVIKEIFKKRMEEGQLDDSGLTLRDLSMIQNVFVETLQGVFHPRIAYAEAAAAAQQAIEAHRQQELAGGEPHEAPAMPRSASSTGASTAQAHMPSPSAPASEAGSGTPTP